MCTQKYSLCVCVVGYMVGWVVSLAKNCNNEWLVYYAPLNYDKWHFILLVVSAASAVLVVVVGCSDGIITKRAPGMLYLCVQDVRGSIEKEWKTEWREQFNCSAIHSFSHRSLNLHWFLDWFTGAAPTILIVNLGMAYNLDSSWTNNVRPPQQQTHVKWSWSFFFFFSTVDQDNTRKIGTKTFKLLETRALDWYRSVSSRQHFRNELRFIDNLDLCRIEPIIILNRLGKRTVDVNHEGTIFILFCMKISRFNWYETNYHSFIACVCVWMLFFFFSLFVRTEICLQHNGYEIMAVLSNGGPTKKSWKLPHIDLISRFANSNHLVVHSKYISCVQ